MEKYFVIEKYPNPWILVNGDGSTLYFDDFESAKKESEKCQDGIVCEYLYESNHDLNIDGEFIIVEFIDPDHLSIALDVESELPKIFNNSKYAYNEVSDYQFAKVVKINK